MSWTFTITGSEEELELACTQLWSSGCQGIEERPNMRIAYFEAKQALPLAGTWQQLDDTDWVSHYYDTLEPLVLQRLIIAPTHCHISPDAPQQVIWLNPGMAFGTGHHETTRMALEALEALELADKTVLDVGAGSGILAIAADLLGADATGVDTDPVTVPIAQANAEANHSQARFILGTLDSNVASASYDVLVTNLFAELHAMLAREYLRVLKPGGQLIATGIWHERFAIAHNALRAHFDIITIRHEGDWALIHAQK